MPKEIVEIKGFQKGVIGSVADQDIPQDAASYSENLDPLSPVGQLEGIPGEQQVFIGVDGRTNGWLRDKATGKDHMVVVRGDYHIDAIKDFYGQKESRGTPTLTSLDESSGETHTMTLQNNALYLARGGSSSTPPLWVGLIKQGQFEGTANAIAAPSEELQADEATLKTDGLGNTNEVWTTGFTESGTGGNFSTSEKYYWGLTLVYDGFQESEIIQAHSLVPGSGATSIAYDLKVDKTWFEGNASRRITAISVYRGYSTDTGLSEPESDYELVEEVSVNDDAWSESSGVYTYSITDRNEAGASYQGRVGISQVIDSQYVHYGLNVQMLGQNFVADCWHPEVEDAQHYVFRSQPLQFSSFDWTKDYAILPFAPVAMNTHNGRIYCFSESQYAIIDPATMSVEEVVDGFGAEGPHATAATEFGLFVADRNNIYRIQTLSPELVGNPIQELGASPGDSWTGRDATSAAHLAYHPLRQCLLVRFRDEEGYDKAWQYTVPRERWDLVPIATNNGLGQDGFYGFLEGKRGELYFTSTKDADILRFKELMKDRRNAWTWRSKEGTIRQDTQKKWFYKIHYVGELKSGRYRLDGGSWTDLEVKDGHLAFPGGRKQGRSVQFEVSGLSAHTIESLGVLYRRRPPR